MNVGRFNGVSKPVQYDMDPNNEVSMDQEEHPLASILRVLKFKKGRGVLDRHKPIDVVL